MSTEQREKDLKLLRDAAQLADGVEAISQQLEKVRLARVLTANALLGAHLALAPRDVIQRRAAAHNAAEMVEREVEEYYYDAIRANAEYLRKEAAK